MPQYVLVVEDDDSIRKTLMDYLHDSAALDVDGARDGVEALHCISTRIYAVIVLDLMMPYMSGVDFLDSLEALSSDPSVKALDAPPPVVIITGAPQEAVASADLEHRFPGIVRGVFRKPLDVRALARCVQSLAEAR